MKKVFDIAMFFLGMVLWFTAIRVLDVPASLPWWRYALGVILLLCCFAAMLPYVHNSRDDD